MGETVHRLLRAALVLVVLGPASALAQPKPPGPGPGPGPGAGGPRGPGPASPGPADAVRSFQELRAGRVQQLLGNKERAAKLTELLEQHDAKKQTQEDERAKLVKRIEHVLHAMLEAKVTALKGDEVMLSVGSDALVGAGVLFDVRHGGQVVGRVVVSKVTSDACVAKIVSRADGQKIQKGDAATFAGFDGGGEKPADKAGDLPALLDALQSKDGVLRAAEEELAKKVRELLPPAEAAKVLLFLERFKDEARTLLLGK